MSLDKLLQGEIARDVLRAYRRDLTLRTAEGEDLPEHWPDIIDGLLEAASRTHVATAASGSAPGSVASGSRWVTVREGADAVQRKPRWVRQLVAEHRVRSLQVDGRTTLVDLDSLKSVIAKGAR